MPNRIAVSLALVLASAAFASSADAKTIHILSRSVSNSVFDPSGNPLGPGAEPTVGSRIVIVDRDYRGTAKHHSRKPMGSDHVVCTVLDPVQGQARCDAFIALAGGAVVSTNQVVSFAAPRQVFKITAGLGSYRRAKGGTVTSVAAGASSSDSDLTVKY